MATLEKAPKLSVLRRIKIGLLHPEERSRFDKLLEERYYFPSARLGGQSLRYVAELDEEWIALVSFSAPALHIKAREDWNPWLARQRSRRLNFVVNNSRFLILPDRKRYPNLASRILSLCCKRVSADWEQEWNHPVLVVESFVNESKYW
jgi:hypothetical protein